MLRYAAMKKLKKNISMLKVKNMSITFILFALSFAFVTSSIKSFAMNSVYNDEHDSSSNSILNNTFFDKNMFADSKSDINTTAIPYEKCDVYYTFQGSGTSSNPYLLSNIDDLTCLAWKTNNGIPFYQNKVWSLTDNIDLEGNIKNQWIPIGTSSDTPFSGSFYGDNHTISGLYIDNEKSDFQGFIGYASSINTISNIGIINSYVKGNNGVGSLIGYVAGNIATIFNSYNTGSVTGVDNVGGLVGCIHNKKNIGLIEFFMNSYNKGSIKGLGDNVAGLLGFVNSNISNIENLHNTGNIEGDKYTAGLFGNVSANIATTLKNSYNKGDIRGYNAEMVAGLIGHVTNIDGLEDSYNTGHVTGGTDNIGGLIGHCNSIIVINNSYNKGNIEGSKNSVGGLVGYAEIELKTISNSYNIGNVKGTDNIGGLIGLVFQSITFSNSYNTGFIRGSGYYVGGLI